MNAMQAKKALEVFGKKTIAESSCSIHTDEVSFLVRERLLWALGKKMDLHCETKPLDYDLLNEDARNGDFLDMFYSEGYSCEESDSNAFATLLHKAFSPLGKIESTGSCFFPIHDEDTCSSKEDWQEILDGYSDEALNDWFGFDKALAKAIPVSATLMRDIIEHDPAHEYSDMYVLVLKSERIGTFLEANMQGTRAEYIRSLIKDYLSEPYLSRQGCFSGTADGVWYALTIIGTTGDMEMIADDAINPKFIAAAVVVEEGLKEFERGGAMC